ncbi:putative secreted protein (Por secretion system target) [Flavobacterium lindanitolerans]|uniref:Putative secreted protein (Por secretion system target) n=1 Tax=Flavobacterium lindanitolerans TaxID=428988 RepID=A0A497U2U7_9FLAO|nr:T9SS type A sorting domain-containing protein [Flavobacterium lindanitolerans]RLJ24137.1 putative secreted protein (Por secretion system target) [Flavobacterium lindanitolerans]
MKLKFTLLSIAFSTIGCLNAQTGFNTTAVNWTLPQGGYLSSMATHGFNAIADGDTGNIDGDQTWTTMDMNGDGKPDLVVTSQKVTIGNYGVGTAFGLPSTPHWKVYLNSGNGFATTAVNWTLPQGGYLSSMAVHGFNAIADGDTGNMDGDQTWTVMDMNGDSKPDLVVTSQKVTIGNYGVGTAFGLPSTPHWKVYLNSGNGFATTAVNWTLPQGGYLSSMAVHGFNAIADGSTGNIDGDQTWTVMDMNGDSRPDLVVTSQEVTIGNYGVDTAFGLPSTPHWKVYLNSGNGFATTAVNWTLPQGGYLSSMAVHGFNAIADGSTGNIDGDQTWTVMDMNGDSRPDLVVTSQEVTIGNYGVDTAFGLPSTPYWKVYLTGSTLGTDPFVANKKEIVVYPNPSNGKFLIKAETENINVVINDLAGRTVSNQTGTTIDLSGYPQGIYLMNIQIEDEMFVKKIILE